MLTDPSQTYQLKKLKIAEEKNKTFNEEGIKRLQDSVVRKARKDLQNTIEYVKKSLTPAFIERMRNKVRYESRINDTDE